MKSCIGGESAAPKDRQALEGFHIDRRSLELRLDTVRGDVDAMHLKEINWCIFQDLPGFGFDDVTPGQHQPTVAAGSDRMKNRRLSMQLGSFFCSQCGPVAHRAGLPTSSVMATAPLYASSQQLANEADYTILWENFALNDLGRDLLYTACDKSVNQSARPHLQHEHSLRKIMQTEARMAPSRNLPDLFRDVVRPLRSLAFERLTQTQAFQVHPEQTAA